MEEEVQIELVTDEPAVGTSAKWVPDTEVPLQAATSAPLQASEVPSLETPIGTMPASKADPAIPDFAAAESQSATPGQAGFGNFGDAPTTSDGTSSSTMSQMRRKKKKGSWLTRIVIGLIALAGMGTLGFVYVKQQEYQERKELAEAQANDPAMMDPANVKTPEDEPYSALKLEGSSKIVKEFAPTSGKPIELYMMPSGVNMVIHLRPALLWSNERHYQELRASLTSDVTDWLAAQLKATCRRDPEQIDEALIGLILGPRESEPEVCAVVRLTEPDKLSNLLDEFKGTYLYDITERPDLRLRVDDKYGYLIHDESTIAICPANLAGELEYWIKSPNYEVSEGMTQMLHMSDRDRLFTFISNAGDLNRNIETIIPESGQQTVTKVMEFIGEDVETVSWSLHTQPYFHSQVHIRPKSGINPISVNNRLKAQLDDLPDLMWKEVCMKMKPQQLRFRTFIGRLPAMLEAFQESTVHLSGERYMSMTTVLPAKAAPNLALAGLFTANEAERTDFSVETKTMVAQNKPKIPDTVAGRLRLPVDAEFSGTPLQAALQYLCDEAQLKLDLEGPALKDAGFTQNELQTFNLGIVPMEVALATIVNKYKKQNGNRMVVCIDEESKTLLVTMKKFADNAGKKIADLKTE